MTEALSALRRRLQDAVGQEFTVGDLLGQGGFATVFRARDNELNRDVAIKVLDLHVAPSATLAERFLREAQTIARLEHPNIVPIYDVERRGDLLYLVMRCVDGPSLRQLLAQHPRLSVGDAARIARQVADALVYAHSQGIVHRDVKPDNVLLDRAGHVLVTDFGIAKALEAAASTSQLTAEGMIIGTPQYMSPEQAAGEAVDGRSDIYSLGVVLYQMLAGATPFEGDSTPKILAKQMTVTPRPIRELRSDVSPELGFALDRMLAKDPAGRFQSAAEVSRTLVAALPGAARDSIRMPLRHRLPAIALKSVVGLGLAGCLIGVAFLAGAVVMAFTVLSVSPRLAARAPVPDSLTTDLRRRGVLARDDTVDFAFVPGREDSVLLLVSRRRVAVVTPRRVRTYPRDSVRYDSDLRLRDGARIVIYLRFPDDRRDTVYRAVSPREFLVLAPRLDSLLLGDARVRARMSGGAGVRVEPD